VFDGREGLQAKHQLPAQSDARHRSPLAVDEDPAAQSLGVGRQNPIRSIGDVNLPNLAWLPEMDVHVQWVLAIFGELICVRQLHVFLPPSGASSTHSPSPTIRKCVWSAAAGVAGSRTAAAASGTIKSVRRSIVILLTEWAFRQSLPARSKEQELRREPNSANSSDL
jgi:hypothetical protein